jgi:hypothetical protein
MTADHNDLDAAIDRAVHDMLDVEPSPALRARVMRRLDRPVHSPTRWMWVAAPLAAAAVLAAALWVPRQAPISSRPVSVDARVEAPPAHVVSIHADSPNAPEVSEPRRAGERVIRVATAARATPFQSSVAIAPLQDVPPIGVKTVPYEAVAAEPMVIAPLSPIDPITIEPLSPPTRRN